MMISHNISVVEELRQYMIEHVMNVKSMKEVWTKWRGEIVNRVGDPPDPEKLLALGDHLSDIFDTTRGDGRQKGQGMLSKAGFTWEGLICWYCNICLLGSRIVIMKYKKDLIPKPLRDAVTVSYGNVSATSEADLMAIVFPKHNDYSEIRPSPGKKQFLKDLDILTRKHFKEHELGVIQCKTNWNDNVQVVMLWDIVYKLLNVPNTNIHVGTSEYSINDLNKFTYSFVTVPTNDWKGYNAKSLKVKRVSDLSGSNYWGHPTKDGVANSVREIFRNFRNGFTGSPARNRELENIRGRYSYFNLYE